MLVSQKLLELYFVQTITSWILYYYHQCRACSFQNSISFVKQDIDFQLGSTLPVELCKIASFSYISRAKHRAVFYHLNSISVPLRQIQFYFVLQTYNRKWNFKLAVHSQWNNSKLPVSYMYAEWNIVQFITS